MSLYSVSSTSELQKAYAEIVLEGGGTIYLEPGTDPFSIILRGGQPDDPSVTITSADPEDPSHVSIIWLDGIHNLSVDNVFVDSSGLDRADYLHDIQIGNSTDVEITNSSFLSTANTFAFYGDGGTAESLALVDNVDGFSFVGNTVSNYVHGMTILESSSVEIIGNDISKIQADGIRMGGVEDVLIKENYLHDWLGSTHHLNHDDMIQVWGVNTTPSSNIIIDSNVFDSGDGPATQTILIGNELFPATEQRHEDITVTNNLIYNGHLHGITVNHTNGVEISNNTLLHNSQSETFTNEYGVDGYTMVPIITQKDSINVVISDNITQSFPLDESVIATGNIIVDFNNLTAENYVYKHFTELDEGGHLDLRGLELRADSPWNGKGADFTQSRFEPGDQEGDTHPSSPEIEPDINPSSPEIEPVDKPKDVDHAFKDGSNDSGLFSWLFDFLKTLFGSGEKGPTIETPPVFSGPRGDESSLENLITFTDISVENEVLGNEDNELLSDLELDFVA